MPMNVAHEGHHVAVWQTYALFIRSVAPYDVNGNGVVGNGLLDPREYAQEVRAYEISSRISKATARKNELSFHGQRIWTRAGGVDYGALDKLLANHYKVYRWTIRGMGLVADDANARRNRFLLPFLLTLLPIVVVATSEARSIRPDEPQLTGISIVPVAMDVASVFGTDIQTLESAVHETLQKEGVTSRRWSAAGNDRCVSWILLVRADLAEGQSCSDTKAVIVSVELLDEVRLKRQPSIQFNPVAIWRHERLLVVRNEDLATEVLSEIEQGVTLFALDVKRMRKVRRK